MSAPVRSQRSNVTLSMRVERRSASRRLQPSNDTRESFVPSNDAMSARQSRNGDSRTSPPVHISPVKRLSDTVTRRIEPLRTTAFERSQRSSSQSLRNRFSSRAPLRSVASKRASTKPSARASIPASAVSTSATCSQLSPSAASSGVRV